MAGTKESYQVDLNSDHIAFVKSAKEKYDIADDGKIVERGEDFDLEGDVKTRGLQIMVGVTFPFGEY